MQVCYLQLTNPVMVVTGLLLTSQHQKEEMKGSFELTCKHRNVLSLVQRFQLYCQITFNLKIPKLY